MEIAVLKFFSSLRSEALSVLFCAFSLLGERVIFAAIVLLLLIFLPREQKKRVFFGVLLSIALNAVLKYTISRPRPYLSGEILKLDPPLSAPLNPNTSFPSGHVQLVATLCGCLISGKRKLSLLLLLPPLFVALSRLYFGVHYPTDVICGLFFGFASALIARAIPTRPQNA